MNTKCIFESNIYKKEKKEKEDWYTNEYIYMQFIQLQILPALCIIKTLRGLNTTIFFIKSYSLSHKINTINVLFMLLYLVYEICLKI